MIFLICCNQIGQAQDVQAIIRRSVEANDADWHAAPDYECFEVDNSKGGTVTYDDKMISGSPYQELVAVNGKPLSAQRQKAEQQKLQQVEVDRRHESASRRAQRIAAYERGRQRDHFFLEQLTKAFNFRLQSQQELKGHLVYLIQATPKARYRPPDREAQVLTGMQGTLWIDTATSQWMKVEAKVIHPVSIYGFLAKVEPGTSFLLEKSPVAGDIWLPDHFAVHSAARLLDIIPHNSSDEETYYGCKKIETASARTAK